MSPRGDKRFERILVGLDLSSASLEALDAAAELAERLGARLEGLFVEDENLLRLSALPMARVFQITGAGHPLDRGELEGQFAAMAEDARRALEMAAEVHNLKYAFKVVRGQVPAELLSAAREADLLVVGREGRRVARRGGAGGTAVRAAASAPVTVFLPRGEESLGGRLLVAYDAAPESDLALALAARLEEAGAGELMLLLVAADVHEAERLLDKAQRRLERTGPLTGRWLGGQQLDRVAASLADFRPGDVLVLAAGSSLVARTHIAEVLEVLDCPVLLVR